MTQVLDFPFVDEDQKATGKPLQVRGVLPQAELARQRAVKELGAGGTPTCSTPGRRPGR